MKARRATILDRAATWLYKRTWRSRVRAMLGKAKIAGKGMVGGRPTSVAGLDVAGGSRNLSLIGRSYGTYRDVLDTLKQIRDYNPDAALAIWNTLRMANPGHEVHVYYEQAGPDGEPAEDIEGAALVNDLAERVGSEYGGGLDVLLDVLNLTLMTQGAMAAEVELSENLREVLDYCPVDPRWIDFARDPETGKAQPVITSYGEVKPINQNQFRYIPLDPDVDNPHGRSPLWPVMEIIFFQQEVLRDLKAVMHNQGYPRLDVSVLEEIVVQNTPEYLKAPGREDDFRMWVDGFLSDLQATYNALHPDDTFIHWDWVKVGYVDTYSGTGSLDVARVIQVIDTQMVAALKQMPILLGRNEGATTTHATVQWQIYVAGIEALQRRTKRMVEWLHNTALRVYGRQSYARVEFDEIRKSDRKAEAEAERIETETLVTKVLAGWMDNDEAAVESVGHEAKGAMSLSKGQAGAGQATSTGQVGEPGDKAVGARMLGPQPEGIPDYLWERVRDTGQAYEAWAERTFAEKMSAYLKGETAGEKTARGNGHEPAAGEPDRDSGR